MAKRAQPSSGLRLEGKVAVITGGANGIGLACARLFAAQGALVAIGDINVERGRAAAKRIRGDGGEATFIRCDVRRPLDATRMVEAAVDAYGAIDVAVLCAGVAIAQDFLLASLDDWRTQLDINLTGMFLTGQACARRMVRQRRGGAIVTIASTESFVGHAALVPYVASKGGVAQLTRGMAVALADKDIRVNGVAPGSIMTDALVAFAKNPRVRRMQLSRTPLGRYGRPEEIAAVALFLACDDSSYITGQLIVADGGRLALHYTVPVNERALGSLQ
jgi:glucose 1-dehydrogenase